MVGRWALDEGAGASAADSSGYGNPGTILGAATWGSGHSGSALTFDGATGRVKVGTATALEPAAVTAMAWFKRLGSPGAWKYIVAKGHTGCIAASYGIYSGRDGGLRFYVSDQAGTRYTISADAGTGVWDGAWHHVAGTFDGSVIRLYVDGAEVGPATPRSEPIEYDTLNGRDLFIGHYPGCSGLDLDGSIDDVRIYDRALTASVINAAMKYEFKGFFSPVDNVPTVNVAKAGSAIPVKFSLTGDQGLGIFAVGSPSSRRVSCSTSAPADDIELTVITGGSGLSYDAGADRYSYVWKTDKSWSGTCRQLTVEFVDGVSQSALMQFK